MVVLMVVLMVLMVFEMVVSTTVCLSPTEKKIAKEQPEEQNAGINGKSVCGSVRPPTQKQRCIKTKARNAVSAQPVSLGDGEFARSWSREARGMVEKNKTKQNKTKKMKGREAQSAARVTACK